jgi:sensor c-di-GMP phosphodiesterase-like protein
MDAEEIRSEDDRLIVNDVARAVEERELIAYYQPLVDLESMEVVGAESLVRWTMPDGTVVTVTEE